LAREHKPDVEQKQFAIHVDEFFRGAEVFQMRVTSDLPNSSRREHELLEAKKLHHMGRLLEAQAIYERLLANNPNDAELLNLYGISQLQRRNLDAAEKTLHHLTEVYPCFSKGHINLANVLMEKGDLDQATIHFKIAIQIEPSNPAPCYNLGLLLAKKKDYPGALENFSTALSFAPDDPELNVCCGTILLKLDRPAEALSLFDHVLHLTAEHPQALMNRGIALQELRRPQEALASHDKALALRPDYAEARLNRGNILEELGLLREALMSYENALAVRPNYVEAHNNRGNVLLKLARPEEALISYRSALEILPDYAEAHLGLGNAYMILKRSRDALSSYGRALDIRDDFMEAILNRGKALRELGQTDDALTCYEHVLKLAPENAEALSELVFVHQKTCNWDLLEPAREQLINAVQAGKTGSDPFTMLSISDDPSLHQKAARAQVQHMQTAYRIAPSIAVPDSDRLRVGYFSADFYNHAVMQLLVGVLESHNRTRFEVQAFALGPETEDAMRSRTRQAVSAFHACSRLSDAEIAQIAQAARLDVAIDLTGHTRDARPEIFMARVAPVQVSFLGYPGTIGAGFMDYVIADPTVLPMDQQPFYDEKIVHLPDTYQPNDRHRIIAKKSPSRIEVGLPPVGFIYCCFNNIYKINPEFFASATRILSAVPGSVLWLLSTDEQAMQRLRAAAAASGVDGARLIFGPSLPTPEHLARYRLADLFLDTLPYNAHTTASEALWAGLPVLTQLGRAFAGRVAASLLRAVGLPELVTESITDYEALAITLGRDPERMVALKAKLAAAIPNAPLFDTVRYTRHLEDAFRIMVERHRAGLPPESFAVPARA
jgi:predicted O-linked N-acetylglucosamine transferase (SPINDLY family)